MNLTDIFNQKKSGMGGATTQPLASYLPEDKLSTNAFSSSSKTPGYTIKNRGVYVTDDDLTALRPLIYGEISNRTPDKQMLETNVIFNTALNRMKEYARKGQNRTLAEVLSMPNQYQAYGGAQYKAYSNPPDVVALAKKKQVDAMIDALKTQIATGNYNDNTEGAYFYIHNPDGTIAYDNKRPLFAR